MAKRYFKEYKLVATEVGKEVPFLKESSCMSPEKRIELAACKAFRTYFSKDKDFNKFLEEIAEPTLELFGFAAWNRDILTDMGLRVTSKTQVASIKKLKKT